MGNWDISYKQPFDEVIFWRRTWDHTIPFFQQPFDAVIFWRRT